MYAILDPVTKLLSLHETKTSRKCYKALSLDGARVIYGGECPRRISSANGGKNKFVKLHCIEVTVVLKHKGTTKKHYLATSDMEVSDPFPSEARRI